MTNLEEMIGAILATITSILLFGIAIYIQYRIVKWIIKKAIREERIEWELMNNPRKEQ